ncbi:MAG: response regulator [Desulfobacterales bacterium]|nr:response regulator [Desulfobacterales bacterium]
MKILVVDDEVVSRKKLEHLVKKFGYDVLTATDGEEAWEIWKTNSPRIIITDRQMPRIDGVKLCSMIRKNETEDYTFIIIVTNLDESNHIIEGMKAGADDYITKPFNKNELYFRIKAGERILNLQDKDIVIFSLAKLAESRDLDTGNHLERVRYFCRIISEKIKVYPNAPAEINSKFIENIFLTSPMHDIGKVGVPDSILLKPGKLTKQEFDIMKTHTTIGYNTLNQALKKNPKAGYLKMSCEIALFHHERFDGKGYPNGLKGDSIPLSAKIIALADVYDALTTERPYKVAFSHEKAVSIIIDGEGSHFDPIVIGAFNQTMDKFIEIKKRFYDVPEELAGKTVLQDSIIKR